MNQTTKTLLVAFVCLFVGAAGVLAWTRYNATQQENLVLKSQLQNSPTASPVVKASTAPVAAIPTPTTSSAPSDKKVAAQTGSISGTLGYPSSGIPPLEIFAMKQGDTSVYFKLKTTQNQSTFTISDVTAGTYVVVAYPVEAGSLAGGYTKAVACGLSVECIDHSLVPVVVTAGQVSSDVMVKDWYAPEGTFPAKPE